MWLVRDIVILPAMQRREDEHAQCAHFACSCRCGLRLDGVRLCRGESGNAYLALPSCFVLGSRGRRVRSGVGRRLEERAYVSFTAAEAQRAFSETVLTQLRAHSRLFTGKEK
jgi:hypothetical protein